MSGNFKNVIIPLIVSFFLLPKTYSQDKKIKGYIINSSTKEALPYATIKTMGQAKMTDADETGFFDIAVNKNDTLFFSSVGFHGKIIRVLELNDKDSIFLDAIDIVLPEALVGKTKTIEIGELNDKKKFDTNCPCSTRSEMATKISVSPALKRYQVKKIRIRGFGFNSENPVRIHLYSVGNFGEPLNDLLTNDIVIKEDSSKNEVLAIDIEDQNIILDLSSFFIGVQWISDTFNLPQIRKGKRPLPKRPAIYGTYSFKNAQTYIRDKTYRFGYKWAFYAYPGSYIVLYPYDFKRPDIVKNPYSMLVSAEVSGY